MKTIEKWLNNLRDPKSTFMGALSAILGFLMLVFPQWFTPEVNAQITQGLQTIGNEGLITLHSGTAIWLVIQGFLLMLGFKFHKE